MFLPKAEYKRLKDIEKQYNEILDEAEEHEDEIEEALRCGECKFTTLGKNGLICQRDGCPCKGRSVKPDYYCPLPEEETSEQDGE